jgi:hypothetical protein
LSHHRLEFRMGCLKADWLLCPPFEEEGHIALHLSVGRSVGRYVSWSVDQTMSTQYLENLSLDCYDISYMGWWWVEEESTLRSIGQRSKSFKTGNRNILSAQYLENPFLDRLQT